MNPIQFDFTSQDMGAVPIWVYLLIGIAELLWLWSIVGIAQTKTEDPYDRIVWLLIVLALNFVGTVLYFFASGHYMKGKPPNWVKTAPETEEEIKRRANEGTL